MIVEDSHPDGLMGIYDPIGGVQADRRLPRREPERRGGPAHRPARDRPPLRDGRGAPRRSWAMAEPGEAVIGLEIHVQLRTRTKMFCGCELSFGDEPERPHLPGLPRPPGRAADGQRAGGPLRPPDRPGAGLRDRSALDLPPQELLLSRQPEGVPDQPVRHPARAQRATRRHPHPPRPPRGGRGEARSTSASRAASTARAPRSWTSTAAARRWSRSSPSPTCATRRRRASGCSSCARRSRRSAPRT